MTTNKLVRSFDDKVIAGVCGGLARYFDTDPSIIRLGFALATIFGVGAAIPVYIVMALIVPSELDA